MRIIQIRCKVTTKIAYMQVFVHFFCRAEHYSAILGSDERSVPKIHLFLFYAKCVVFLTQITDDDGDEGDEHLRRRRIPTEGLDT